MTRSIYVECPTCKTLLEVNAENGSVIRCFKKEHAVEEGKDSLTSAVEKIKKDARQRETRFHQAKEEEKKRKEALEHLFKQKTEEAKEDTAPPPVKPFDLD